MNFKAIANTVTTSVSMNMLKAKKQSPALMFGAGVVGVVATVVLASKATLKLEEIVEDTNKKIEQSKSLIEQKHPDYSLEDHKKDVAITYVQASVKIAKLYAPALAVGLLSIASLTGAHVVLTKRNAGLMAAYAALEEGFRKYRSRVIAEVGEEKEREFRYGVETREVYSEGPKGEPIVETVKRAGGASIYARLFDEMNPNWNPTPEYNLLFIKAAQTSLNNVLNAKGFVLLNDAYDQLGMDRTKAGCVVGWLKNGDGNGFVDFGIWDDEDMDRMHDFLTGREGAILLDFNVDGVVFDKI